MLQMIVLVILAFSVGIAIFAVQNTMPVAVSFLTFHADAVAVSLLVLISAAVGAGIMLLLGVAREVQHGLRHRSLSERLGASESRVRELEARAAAAAPTSVTAEPALRDPADTFHTERPAAASFGSTEEPSSAR